MLKLGLLVVLLGGFIRCVFPLVLVGVGSVIVIVVVGLLLVRVAVARPCVTLHGARV